MKPLNCPVCHDQGIVELSGYSKDGYSRGSAPCQLCDAGQALTTFLKEKKEHPLTDYSLHSLADPPQTHYHAVTKQEALAEWEACDHDWQDDGQPQARAWAGDSIQQQLCKCGKQRIITIPTQPTHSTRRSDQ